jgi:N-acetyl-gamma-glutamyl-phosphate reductase
VVFLATPPEVSMELAPHAGLRRPRGRSQRRLPPGHARELRAWYKETHTQPELLAEAVYGLPEFCRDRIPAARLVSNPGCYPTAANLALRPLLQAGVIDRAGGIVCDAKSASAARAASPASRPASAR